MANPLIKKTKKSDRAVVNISIRKLDKNIYDQLCLQAVAHNVSMEEEARNVLAKGVAVPENIVDIFEKYFGEKNGVDLDGLLRERKPHEPMSFEE